MISPKRANTLATKAPKTQSKSSENENPDYATILPSK
jgi:hypothetical protein